MYLRQAQRPWRRFALSIVFQICIHFILRGSTSSLQTHYCNLLSNQLFILLRDFTTSMSFAADTILSKTQLCVKRQSDIKHRISAYKHSQLSSQLNLLTSQINKHMWRLFAAAAAAGPTGGRYRQVQRRRSCRSRMTSTGILHFYSSAYRSY